MTSSGGMEEVFYLLTNAGFLLGALPVLVAGIMVLRAGRHLAGVLLTAGAAMVGVEMLFWTLDSLLELVGSATSLADFWTDQWYLFVTAFGAVGSLLVGAGILMLALLFQASRRENVQLHEMVKRD